MRYRLHVLMFLTVITVLLSACIHASVEEPAAEASIQSERPAARETNEPEEEHTGESETEGSFTSQYAGIQGHIKEVRGDAALISSDTDDFPGVFWVTGVQKLAVEEELKGGTSVFVLMEDMKEKESDGIRKFRGKQLMALPEDETVGKADILLTSPPVFSLTDPLSSRYQPFEIISGNYSWGIREGTEATEEVACGAAPLEEAAGKSAARLKVPEYSGTDSALYTFSTVIAPDKLVIRRWDAEDMGSREAKEECIVTYYSPGFTIELENDKIYEFAAEWKEENVERNGFWGNAAYVLVTGSQAK